MPLASSLLKICPACGHKSRIAPRPRTTGAARPRLPWTRCGRWASARGRSAGLRGLRSTSRGPTGLRRSTAFSCASQGRGPLLRLLWRQRVWPLSRRRLMAAARITSLMLSRAFRRASGRSPLILSRACSLLMGTAWRLSRSASTAPARRTSRLRQPPRRRQMLGAAPSWMPSNARTSMAASASPARPSTRTGTTGRSRCARTRA
mmetsp:Transcript_31937/g.78355  ORF Transcript_31937/g.78355 Transcript_31937/m.78355 type:complete len:205 (-) Transcript_31937:407-1021(-)